MVLANERGRFTQHLHSFEHEARLVHASNSEECLTMEGMLLHLSDLSRTAGWRAETLNPEATIKVIFAPRSIQAP